MTPKEIYDVISDYSEERKTIICNLHSACTPYKKKVYMCKHPGSSWPVINFDAVKEKLDKSLSRESKKSVDALTISPNEKYLCFVELKSWNLLLSHNGTEHMIQKKAAKYKSDLPLKISDSFTICQEICEIESVVNTCKICYILVTDISVEHEPLASIQSNLTALAGTSSKLLCNQLSQDIMNGITGFETHYWCCRDFDKNIQHL